MALTLHEKHKNCTRIEKKLLDSIEAFHTNPIFHVEEDFYYLAVLILLIKCKEETVRSQEILGNG